MIFVDNYINFFPHYTHIIEIYLVFLQHAMEVFKLSIKELEMTEATVVDIFNIMAGFRNKIRS